MSRSHCSRQITVATPMAAAQATSGFSPELRPMSQDLDLKRDAMNLQLCRGLVIRAFLSALIVLLCVSTVLPQANKGSIAGRVTDSSGGVLQGAKIAIQPAGVNVVSNALGQFLINDLSPGDYTISISYVGFANFSNSAKVVAGQTTSLDAKLSLSSQNLQVLVTAERPAAEAEAINRERTADNILQVLPAEVIRSLP